ncbi:MAG: hypothetical protein COB17_07455 [Sulfurimonas sp.]|nr:MAG: hypothetical protein COB17_07455 [Sulfurimonas sp.]
MNKSIILAFIAIYLPFKLSAEPSAFGAGDINNPSPYGLTSKEKLLLQNKKELKKVIVKSNNQANKVDSLRERLDGLQSIIESLSQKSHENRLNLNSFSIKNELELKNINEYEKGLSEANEVNIFEIDKLKLLISELSTIIDTINTSYVSKNEFNKLVNDVNLFKDLVSKELKSASKAKKSSLSKLSNGDIETKAKKFYDKKNYTKSIEYYEYLISKNYKPARSHYMIGEMNYYRKKYAEAIAYFKKSASLYSKASYMPDLMLHTAISMDKTGDISNAINFYEAVISKYPKTSHSSTALDRLSKLK